MSKTGGHDRGAGSKRKSLFTLSALTQITPNHDEGRSPSRTLRKSRTPSFEPELPTATRDESPRYRDASDSPKIRPPVLPGRGASNRPPSVFGSLRSLRSAGDDDTPLTATSSKAPSINWGDTDGMGGHARTVYHHGEVQTSSGMFRRKREYLVLTDTQLVRCKNQAKASDMFSAVPPPFGKTSSMHRHASMPSTGSAQDLQSLHSDSSGDKEGRIPLRQVVAVHRLDDGRPYFAIEVDYLDDDTNQASSTTLQLGDPEELGVWLTRIRNAANRIRFQELNPISVNNSKNAARAVERDNDYDPGNYAIYKVVQRPASRSGGRSSDDLSKIASTVCFLAIGIHKVHLIPLAKASGRTSSPSLSSLTSQGSFGILTLTALRLSETDDTFELTFRLPMQPSKVLYLASLASHDIAIRLHYAENRLRPECAHRLYIFTVPSLVEREVLPPVESDVEDHNCLVRTLIAYCVAYEVNPTNIRYTITYDCEDAPQFALLKPADSRRQEYSALELLAVMRALRYNETFGTISFASVRLDCLNGLHDKHGSELVCSQTKRGTPIRATVEELGRSCLLVQEVRALAVTSKKLRRMNFADCITVKPPQYIDNHKSKANDMGCGVVEALFPLCRHQTTNVDWIVLNGIQLGETDLDYLVGASVEKACHFRAIEMSRCGLTDRSLSLILDALRAQDNTLESIDISGNIARLSPSTFEAQISVFGFIRKIDLSHVQRTSGAEALIPAETLRAWRLEELRLSGTPVNAQTVEAIASYLRSSQSETLRELRLDHTYLSGGDIALIMHAMTRQPGQARNLHLDISQNHLDRDHDQLATTIASGLAPSHLTIQSIEYEEESLFRELILALGTNNSIRSLDISKASLPCDASEDTCRALERMFSENKTLEVLDISGEDSRLEISKFGVGINRALRGLRRNTALVILHVKYQKLGLQGASTLADVLKENKTLRELHCENNHIPLSGLTDLINALSRNTTLVYLSPMTESRAEALKKTESQVKAIRDETPTSPKSPLQPKASPLSAAGFGMRRGLANVKKNVGKASSYTSSYTHSHTHKERSGSPAAITQLSDQDIKAALRLVDESWDRQTYRLE
ncbi:hypothetical protein LTR04_001704, partial [Oleoguttula sp. CCFEE 6159]